MKKASIIKTGVIVFFVSIMQVTACKSKIKETSTNKDTITTQAPAQAPIEISSDDELARNAKDATKDFPGVTATVSNGEVTLTGTIQRDRLTTLMQSIHSLHPKKINNNLTIQ